MFQVVYGEVVVAVEAYEIVTVALVVAEEEVLAVHAAVVFPPLFRLLDGLSLGVVVVGERDVVFSEICEYGFFSCHVFSAKVICISDFPPFRRIFSLPLNALTGNNDLFIFKAWLCRFSSVM